MKVIAAIGVATLLLAPGAFADGVGSMPKPQRVESPAERATAAYNSGVKRIERANELDKKASTASGAEQQKLQAKAKKEYEKAIGDLESATKLNPSLAQGFTNLGFALRKVGRYDDSLAAYDKSLALVPNYSPALEYRAEAYLGLNRLEEAKSAYVLLFGGDRPRADELAAAMRKWVNDRRADSGGLDAATIDAFASWLDEREAIARQLPAAASASSGSW
jgi:tetratricopeptide (TPR) repeat protein